MGYSVGSLVKISELINATNFTGRRLIDFGSQDVKIFSRADLSMLQKFMVSLGGPRKYRDETQADQFPLLLTANEIFTAAGFRYSCFDVDRRPGTIYLDYGALEFDQSLYGTFDMVMNGGTTEHLSNPVAALFLMHWLSRKDGILFNEVPISGWMNYGLNNLTAKFWHTLRWMNSYEVLSAQVKYAEMAPNDENVTGPHLDFIANLDRAGQNSASIEIIFRKTDERGFIPPYDAVIPTGDGGIAIATLVMGSLHPFVKSGALTQSEAAATVNAFLEYQNLAYRVFLHKQHGQKKDHD